MDRAVTQHLIALGLNRLEAQIYQNLLADGPATGYAIGKRIGKPTANVYKGIEGLSEVGAVIVEEGDRNRICRALPPERFLANLTVRFEADRARAREAFAQMPAAKVGGDDRIYRFDSAAAVIGMAQDMLARCQKIVIVDIFPAVLDLLRPDLIAAAARGVEVFVQTYTPLADQPELTGCHVVETAVANSELPDLFQGQQLNLVIDGLETLIALLSLDLKGVRQAAWSESLYLSFILHVGLMREFNVHEILKLKEDELTYQTVQSILRLDDRFSPDGVPGILQLFQRD